MQPVPIQLAGTGGQFRSRFDVEDVAVACVGVALLAAAALQSGRGGECHRVSLDRAHVAAAVRSERYFRRADASPEPGFGPLSRFWPAADGWVRTHGNFAWHRAALTRALGTTDDVAVVAAALASLPAADIEARVFAAGGVAAAVRSADQWSAHPQGQALADEPLVSHERTGPASPRVRPPGLLPAAGVRVLDLTRVIAGPICTRFLGALGADVLRLDPPHLPDLAVGAAADTLLGKRSARLDFRSAAGLSILHLLLAGSDVVVCGYRPGALDRFDLDPEALALHHPGLVVVYLDAWGHRGPWSARRGFDSVVQAPTGIAEGESASGRPGALPCQLLDHGTGYLAAAAVLDGLARQIAEGGTHLRRLSLARTAMWLTSSGGAKAAPQRATADPDQSPWLAKLESVDGPVAAVAPPGALDGLPLRWPFPLTGYGLDRPIWP